MEVEGEMVRFAALLLLKLPELFLALICAGILGRLLCLPLEGRLTLEGSGRLQKSGGGQRAGELKVKTAAKGRLCLLINVWWKRH